MDRLIYLAMTGAKHTLEQQAMSSHNLANVATTGFRAETGAFRAIYVQGEGSPTRAFVLDSSIGADFSPGSIQHTGRDLDVAIEGKGWIAVQLEDGSEAYTRNGSLQIGPNGLLQTRTGLNVLGDGGTIAIPQDVSITVAGDGTVSTVPTTQQKNSVTAVGRIKLVNPEESQLVRGADGLFRLRDGSTADADASIKLVSGSLESSNVSVVESMVSMIALARQFDMQMKLLQNADSNERAATQLLSLNR